MPNTPTIFLSYNHANNDVADSIDNDFRGIGITFRRDIRDVEYRSNIKAFMNSIHASDFVLMLISDEFLKSEWCMYEVTELLNTHRFQEKILPVVLDNANPIFKPEGRLLYYDYWAQQVKKDKRSVAKYPNGDLREVLRRSKNVDNNLDNFFQTITELKVHSIQELKQQNYRPILDLVGVEDEQLLEEVLAIWQLTDREEREIALEEFAEKYPKNQYYFFSKGYFEFEEKQYKKAKLSYQAALRINPDYAEAHYNLGILLMTNFQGYDLARTHYQDALRINPDDAAAHNNLAVLLANDLNDKDSAKEHYMKATELNPAFIDAEDDTYFGITR